MLKKATWNIVLEGDKVDEISLIADLKDADPEIRIRRADVSISWVEEEDKTNPKSDTSKN